MNLIYETAKVALKLGHKEITVIELCVAGETELDPYIIIKKLKVY